jgi:hypothetical protein
MRISAAFVDKAFHVFVHVSTLEKQPRQGWGVIIPRRASLAAQGVSAGPQAEIKHAL